MISTEQRVTCSEPGPRNDHGKPKLLATITPDGLQMWCKYCRQAHFISREQCEAAWSRGESVLTCKSIAPNNVASV